MGLDLVDFEGKAKECRFRGKSATHSDLMSAGVPI